MTLIPVGPIVIGKDAAGVRFELVARVYREGLAHSQRGDRFVRARLTHAKGSWMGFFPEEAQAGADGLQEGEAIRMEARRLQHKFAGDSLRIERWVRLPADKEHAVRLDLLPSALCPHPYLVETLVDLLDRLTIPALRDFATDVLCDPEIRDRFLTAQASLHAHHNRPGGLIQHSMQVARMVAGFGSLSDTERELGVVAALVHDLGKLRTYNAAGATTELGGVMGHDALTLEMLAGPLKALERRWTDGATSLRHLLVVDTDRKSFHERIEQRVGLVLRFADHWSAHTDKNRRAFRSEGKRYGMASFGRQRFWRPQPPAERANKTAPLAGHFE